MLAAEDTHRWSFMTDSNGVQWVCKGYHHGSLGCEWELASTNMEFTATQDTKINAIDLYDTPIDLRPLPRKGTVQHSIEYLRDHGDHYGVRLLEEMRDEEDAENIERPREEESRGTVRTKPQP